MGEGWNCDGAVVDTWSWCVSSCVFSRYPLRGSCYHNNHTYMHFHSYNVFDQFLFIKFSSNRLTWQIRSSGCDVLVWCLSFTCLSPFHVLDFEAYFAPTFRSRMSKNFRDSEALGKSAGKKWSQN